MSKIDMEGSFWGKRLTFERTADTFQKLFSENRLCHGRTESNFRNPKIDWLYMVIIIIYLFVCETTVVDFLPGKIIPVRTPGWDLVQRNIFSQIWKCSKQILRCVKVFLHFYSIKDSENKIFELLWYNYNNLKIPIA
jgi:hypothetical protein